MIVQNTVNIWFSFFMTYRLFMISMATLISVWPLLLYWNFFMTLCVSQTTGQWPVGDLHWPVRRPWHGPLQEEPRPPFHSVESGSSLPQGNSPLLKTARVRHKNHRAVILNVSCYFYTAIQEIINTWWIFYLWRIPEQTIFIFICYKEMNLMSIILLFFPNGLVYVPCFYRKCTGK